ncbi:hypothetical protein ACFVWR_02665 [Leifsonia sp. NPDC058292]
MDERIEFLARNRTAITTYDCHDHCKRDTEESQQQRDLDREPGPFDQAS